MRSQPAAPPDLRLPAGARAELTTPRDVRVRNQTITVNAGWWNRGLRDRGLPGGPLLGSEPGDGQDSVIELTRDNLFQLAAPVTQDRATDEEVLRLLWHVLAWGSGPNFRQNHKRMDSFTRPGAVDLLRTAGALSRTDPAGAYEHLIRAEGMINGLGPSFFTKYLYFVGAGQIDHPSAILDANVATALNRCGWASLSPGWARWHTNTYASYCQLLARWANKEGARLNRTVAIDELEIWLFKDGASRV